MDTAPLRKQWGHLWAALLTVIGLLPAIAPANGVPDECGTVVPLCAGQNWVVGEVIVTDEICDGDVACVCVAYRLFDDVELTNGMNTDDLYFTEIHADVNENYGDLPKNPGQMAESHSFSPEENVRYFKVCFPDTRTDLELCMYVAAHAVVKGPGGWDQTAWGAACFDENFPDPGPEVLERGPLGKGWATYFCHIGDHTAPEFVQPNPWTLEFECGPAGAPGPWDNPPEAVDGNGEPVDLELLDPGSPTDGCGGTQIQQLLWRATDTCGNEAILVQVIQIVDTIPPVIDCPPDLELECGPGNADAILDWLNSAEATDSCAEPVITNDFDPDTVFDPCLPTVVTVTWTASDGCNETTCSATVTIEDTTPPDIGQPGPNASAECPAIPIFTPPTATDACGAATVVEVSDVMTDGCGGTYSRTVTWQAVDDCDNWSEPVSQTLTLVDTKPPKVYCPPDTTVDCTESTDPDNTGSATARDACSDAWVTGYTDSVDQPDPDCANRVITRTWTAVDACGNGSSCPQVITVVDNTPPEITCPPDTTVDCTESTDPDNTGSATARDACSDAWVTGYTDSVDQPDPDCANRVITRTWTAVDACGNGSSCPQVITVVDNDDPYFISCPPSYSVPCLDDVPACDPADAVATDECGEVTVTCEPRILGGDDCSGTVTYTYLATDACGNTATCTQVITYGDVEPPEILGITAIGAYETFDISCAPIDDPWPLSIVALPEDECVTWMPLFEVDARDDCDSLPIIVTQSIPAFTPLDAPSEQVVVITIEDACGNGTECYVRVSVPDCQTGPDDCCFSTILCAGQSIDAGTLEVCVSEGYLTVIATTKEPWMFQDWHMDIDCDENDLHTKKLNEYKFHTGDGYAVIDSDTMVKLIIPFEDIDDCDVFQGDTVFLAFHAAVGGEGVGGQTAWAGYCEEVGEGYVDDCEIVQDIHKDDGKGRWHSFIEFVLNTPVPD